MQRLGGQRMQPFRSGRDFQRMPSAIRQPDLAPASFSAIYRQTRRLSVEPAFLQCLFTHLPGRAHLRSAKNGDYNCPRVLSGFSRRSFSVSGPDVWNSLPRQLRGIAVASTFKRHLKSELFKPTSFRRLLQPLLNHKTDCITDCCFFSLTICVLSSFLTLLLLSL